MSGLDLLRQEAVDLDRNLALTLLCGTANVAVGALALYRLYRFRQLRGTASIDSRQLAARPWLEWIAAGCACLVVVAFADSLQRARALMPLFPVPAGVPSQTVASSVARSLIAQTHTLMAAAWLVPLPVLAGLAAFVLARSARLQARALRRQLAAADTTGAPIPSGSASLLALSLLLLPVFFAGVPLWRGVYEFGAVYLRGLGAVSQLPNGSDRAAFMVGVCTRSRELLVSSLPLAFAGVLIGAAIAAVLLWKFAPELPAASARSAWLWSAALLAAAAALVALSEPMRLENETPWPRAAAGSAPRLTIPIETPDLRAGDDAPSAPLMLLDTQALFLEGKQLTITPLAGDLGSLKAEWRKANPGRTFAGQLVFACAPSVEMARVDDALRTAALAGYRDIWFAFAHPEVVKRPLIGTLMRRTTDAARARVALDDARLSGATLDITQHADCGSLSAALVALRAAGRDVVIRLPSR